MTNDAETRFAPGVEEFVDLSPAVERDHEVVLLEHAIGFSEGWQEPVGAAVILDGPAIPVLIANQVRGSGRMRSTLLAGRLRMMEVQSPGRTGIGGN